MKHSFDIFRKTGKIDDYLKYREEIAKEEHFNEDCKNKGNRNSKSKLRRDK